MSEQMDFNDGKYTVISDNGRLTALRNGEPWNRDITGDNLIYWMLVEAIRLKEERDASAAKLAKVEGQLAAVERLRPMWAQGHSTDSVAAQVSAAALTSLWDLLGVGNQTSAVVKLKQLLCVSAERDALAAKLAELAELEGQEPVAWMGFGPRDGRAEFSISRPAGSVMRDFNMRPIFARPVPAEQPVNARLLEALEELVAEFGVCGLTEKARAAITSAESAPKAVRLTDEEIDVMQAQHNADFYAGIVVNHRSFFRVIETAVLRKNGIEVAD